LLRDPLEHRHREERPAGCRWCCARPGPTTAATTDPQHLVGDVRGLKSSSSSKSERAMVINVHEVLADRIGGAARSGSKMAHFRRSRRPGLEGPPGLPPRTPGMVREIRTSPSEIMKSRFARFPFLEDALTDGETSAPGRPPTRRGQLAVVQGPWKDRRLLSADRGSRGRRYDAREGGASETVGDAGGSPDRAFGFLLAAAFSVRCTSRCGSSRS